jgi:hypothetical protein
LLDKAYDRRGPADAARHGWRGDARDQCCVHTQVPSGAPAKLTGWLAVGQAPVECALALAGLAEPLFGVFGQEIAQRDAAAPGLGREPPG